ncbi:MAG TPA: serine hydrolase [Gemmatimonadaceae bacterium]
MGDHYWPENAWRSASASDAGMNETQLFISLQNLRAANPLLRSVVVVRHGYRVIGRYFNSSAIDLHTLQSVSKSVTSLLVGIALDKRLIQSPDQTAVSFFPEYADIRNMDDRKQRLTLLDLLSMKTGMAFFESPYPGSPLQQLNDCGCDWLHFVLDTPMSGEPGNQWAYNSGGVILLGGVLRAVSGVPADEFAQQNLFAKLGIARYSWYKGLPNGLPHMGGGLLLTADDLARIGYLVLRHGRWNEDQVVSADWIDRSTARTSQSISGYFPRSADYGLLWWLFPRNGINGSGSNGDYIIAASGTGGQWLFVDPANDLVAVFLSDLGGGSWPSFNYFFDEILPSIER